MLRVLFMVIVVGSLTVCNVTTRSAETYMQTPDSVLASTIDRFFGVLSFFCLCNAYTVSMNVIEILICAFYTRCECLSGSVGYRCGHSRKAPRCGLAVPAGG